MRYSQPQKQDLILTNLLEVSMLQKVCSSSDFKSKRKTPNLRPTQFLHADHRSEHRMFRDGQTKRIYGKKKGCSMATPDILPNGRPPTSQLKRGEWGTNKIPAGQGFGVKSNPIKKGKYKQHIENRG